MRPLVTERGVRGELARVATWLAMADKSTTLVPPPLDVVRDLLALPGWPDIPAIQAITETPVIRPDGTILNAHDYAPDTRLYYTIQHLMHTPIPDTPAREDVDAAIALLCEVFCDFPFDSETSRANVLAVLITPVVRPLIAGPTPLCVIDKPQVGSGASLIAHHYDRATGGDDDGTLLSVRMALGKPYSRKASSKYVLVGK